jgi:FMN phosphatase YigB (HAD superfamily)
MPDDRLNREERSHLGYTRQRIGVCRSILFDRPEKFSLADRLERAYAEGFMATLTDWVALAPGDLPDEWEAIRQEYTRLGRINITLGLMSDQEREAFEARILAFIDRYMAETENL